MADQRKKLLITASTFPRWQNDTEPRFILDYAQAMTEYFDVTVLAPVAIGAKDTETMGNVQVIRYHYFPIHRWETLCYPGAIVPRIKEKKIRGLLVPFLFLALYFKLFRILPNYDVVHAHWLIPQGVVQSFFKKPYIVTGHGGDVTSLNKGLFRYLKKRCLRRAERVSAVSNALKKQIQEICPSIVPTVISMGINIDEFGEQFRQENYFGQNNSKVILFVGRLAEKKGCTYLLDAMKYIDALCVIVGDGPLKQDLQDQAKELNITNKIRFLGPKTHEELKYIYASSDIFVAPSITAKDGDKEGLGLVILEAMASGLPVVASKSGGIVEIVQDGVNGLLFEEKDVLQMVDKITCIIDDQQLYARLKTVAYKTIKQYDYKSIAAKYMTLLGK